MGAATIAIPTRWAEATFQIKELIEDYGRKSGVTIEVILTGELDPEQIYIFEDSLAPAERVICQNAVTEVSEYVNHRLSKDPWQARSDIMKELSAQLETVGEIVDRVLREREGEG
jgi:hypothetical protein